MKSDPPRRTSHTPAIPGKKTKRSKLAKVKNNILKASIHIRNYFDGRAPAEIMETLHGANASFALTTKYPEHGGLPADVSNQIQAYAAGQERRDAQIALSDKLLSFMSAIICHFDNEGRGKDQLIAHTIYISTIAEENRELVLKSGLLEHFVALSECSIRHNPEAYAHEFARLLERIINIKKDGFAESLTHPAYFFLSSIEWERGADGLIVSLSESRAIKTAQITVANQLYAPLKKTLQDLTKKGISAREIHRHLDYINIDQELIDKSGLAENFALLKQCIEAKNPEVCIHEFVRLLERIFLIERNARLPLNHRNAQSLREFAMAEGLGILLNKELIRNDRGFIASFTDQQQSEEY
jgi:hypothetical protein